MRRITAVVWIVAGLSLSTSGAGVEAAQQTPTAPGTQDPGDIRTFTIEKPEELRAVDQGIETVVRAPARSPRAHDALRTTIGLGYVQGADWGTEIVASGGAGGLQVQFATLVTKGRSRILLDRGAISLFDPDRRWWLEAGDVFSNLRGAARGGRVSWQMGARRPAIAVYGPYPGSFNRTTVVSYRDQIQVGQQTLLDAEVASDSSFLLRSRFVTSRLDLDVAYRSTRRPTRVSDASLSGGVRVWHNATITAGTFVFGTGESRGRSHTVAIRLPLAGFLDLTVERAYTSAGGATSSTSAAMAGLTAGGVRLFHRYQVGDYDYLRAGLSNSIERHQTQSMASYQAGSRLSLTLQLATQRTDTGHLQSWEELQATTRLSRTTTLRVVSAVPDVFDAKRLRADLRQELPGRFAVHAEYGRLSAFQTAPQELERSRFKLMFYRTWNVATPARGAEVRGRVLDPAGRPVASARVRLGTYSTDTDATGTYAFRYVPSGDYTLGLDPQFLPADYAWDGRDVRLTLRWSSRLIVDLLVAPLNVVHGRVYTDRNENGRFDPHEGVAGVPLHLGEQVTASDPDGSYSFYNVWPGEHVVRLDAQWLARDWDAEGPTALAVTLHPDRPVTHADFQVSPRDKPIVWQQVAGR